MRIVASGILQQRAIPQEWIWLLSLCGDHVPQKGGTYVLQLSTATALKLRTALKQFDHLANAYVVFASDGHVITTAHRMHSRRRLRHTKMGIEKKEGAP